MVFTAGSWCGSSSRFADNHLLVVSTRGGECALTSSFPDKGPDFIYEGL